MKLAQLCQEFMAVLEEEWPDSELVEAAIVVELKSPDEDLEPGESRNHTPTACTNDSRIYQTGLFYWAYESASWSGEAVDEPPPPEN
jgi:hypothetical protein